MAKPKDDAVAPVERTVVAGPESIAPDYAEWLREFQIDVAAPVTAPQPPPIVEPVDFESLCDQPTEIPGARQESLPLRLGSWQIQDGEGRFEGYLSFIVVNLWHPVRGRMIATHSYARKDGTITPAAHFINAECQPGDVIKLAVFPTGKGYKVIRPVPVA